jgi:hypothetical protein
MSTLTRDAVPSTISSAGVVPASRESRKVTWLPPVGFERTAFLIIAALIIGFKVLAIYHYRSDSDETQHAHVVWNWVTGNVQYRDVFDNHMPLFQLAMAPVMRLIGQRPDVMIILRWTMLPLYFASIWAVYRITLALYGARLAPWSALIASALARFFYTSTEFRTDQAWAALWLIGLAVAVSGRFDTKRAFATGLLIGLSTAVSVKTIPLFAAFSTGALIAFAFAWWRGVRTAPGLAYRALAMALGMVLPTTIVVLAFYSQGLFSIMYYCVVQHNIVTGLKRWGDFSLHQWYYPLSIPLLIIYTWLIFRQTRDPKLAMKRAIMALIPFCFFFLLLSYWPDITREDDLPYVPMIPFALIPAATFFGAMIKSDQLQRKLLTYGLPAVGLVNLFITSRAHNIYNNRMAITTHNIADVLLLTKPTDYVMDTKGDYVFRPRAYYWVLEPLTKARVKLGEIHDSIPADMIRRSVPLCYMRCASDGSRTSFFIAHNYILFDHHTREMGVLGQVLKTGAESGVCDFTITIPQEYDVVTQKGQAHGTLDGKPYAGAIWLAAGQHEFRDSAAETRVAIFWDNAFQKGFLPRFNLDAHLVKEEETEPAGKRTIEEQ